MWVVELLLKGGCFTDHFSFDTSSEHYEIVSKCIGKIDFSDNKASINIQGKRFEKFISDSSEKFWEILN